VIKALVCIVTRRGPPPSAVVVGMAGRSLFWLVSLQFFQFITPQCEYVLLLLSLMTQQDTQELDLVCGCGVQPPPSCFCPAFEACLPVSRLVIAIGLTAL
jgi:hypothetical protein